MNKTFLTIQKGSNRLLAPNFRESEFYSTSKDAPASHPLRSELVEAVQFLRDYYKVPWRVTSTFRTKAHEIGICQKLGIKFLTNSQHLVGRAIDSQPVADPHGEILSDLTWQFTAKQGPVYDGLRDIGINGFGIYDTFIHLDARTGPLKYHDTHGLVASWDNRSDEAKKKAPVEHTPTVKPLPARSTTTKTNLTIPPKEVKVNSSRFLLPS